MSSFECGITQGIVLDCSGKGSIGGLDRRVFITNTKDLENASYNTDAEGYVTAINFKAYGFLYEFVGQKLAHTYTSTIEKNTGGSVNYPQTVVLKLFDPTPADRDVIEIMTASDLVVIVETNNRTFEIFGAENGLTVSESTKESGAEANADTSRSITLTGNERELPRVFLDTDYATSLTTLESYVA